MIEADEGAELTLRTSVATGAITAIWDKKYRKSIRGVPPKVHIGERAWLTEQVAGPRAAGLRRLVLPVGCTGG